MRPMRHVEINIAKCEAATRRDVYLPTVVISGYDAEICCKSGSTMAEAIGQAIIAIGKSNKKLFDSPFFLTVNQLSPLWDKT